MEHKETVGGPEKPAPADDKQLLKGNRTQDLAETHSEEPQTGTQKGTDPLTNPDKGLSRPI